MTITRSTVPTASTSHWVIVPPGSRVQFWIGHGLLATVAGQFTRFRGRLTWDEVGNQPLATAVAVEAASLDTGHATRDAHLRSPDFLDVARFPRIVFASSTVEMLRPDRFHVLGELRLHGVSRPVVLMAVRNRMDDAGDEHALRFTARADLDRRDWGLGWSAPLAGALIGDGVHLVLSIVAVRAEAGTVRPPAPPPAHGLAPVDVA